MRKTPYAPAPQVEEVLAELAERYRRRAADLRKEAEHIAWLASEAGLPMPQLEGEPTC